MTSQFWFVAAVSLTAFVHAALEPPSSPTIPEGNMKGSQVDSVQIMSATATAAFAEVLEHCRVPSPSCGRRADVVYPGRHPKRHTCLDTVVSVGSDEPHWSACAGVGIPVTPALYAGVEHVFSTHSKSTAAVELLTLHDTMPFSFASEPSAPSRPVYPTLHCTPQGSTPGTFCPSAHLLMATPSALLCDAPSTPAGNEKASHVCSTHSSS